jgi:hypothetical protein
VLVVAVTVVLVVVVAFWEEATPRRATRATAVAKDFIFSLEIIKYYLN